MKLTVKCVSCSHKIEVGPSNEMPMCPECYSPMIAVGASSE